ncbi:MAG: aminotransferase class V-fold PLP-dependent enzyme [Enterobacterales bacterium]|nr:aminotransferase class V-fold PLP-dependent enzyme [Enterobacterales bacterium]
MKKTIYLDYAATTPVDPRVAETLMANLTMDGCFGNPASRSHRYGWQAEEVVDIARNQVADLIGADAREIVWTSGATEADNLVLKGMADNYPEGHIITSAIEHKAILDTCGYLAQKGMTISIIQPGSNGIIDPLKVEQAIQKNTCLISIMQVNNELGTRQDIQAIGEIAHRHQIAFHVDAAQSAGKIKIDMRQLKVDFMSFSAHKIYGPKGIGALYARLNQQSQLKAIIHGGGHERGLRSGTLPTHQIAAMGHAFELAQQELQQAELFPLSKTHLGQLKQQFIQGVTDIAGIKHNAPAEKCTDGIINLRFDGFDSEMLLMAFKDLAISSGSACTSASVEPSYVLKAIGLTDQQAHSSLRFSFGRFTQPEDISQAIQVIDKGLKRLTAFNQAS